MGKGRAPCCDKSKVRTGPWSPAEDLSLVNFIRKHGHSNWRALPKRAGLFRCGKSCRLRWINYLRPDLKRGNFTPKEELTIINLHNSIGNKWSKIASYLPGRTDNEIKNVWNTHLKKRLQTEKSTSLNNSHKTEAQHSKMDYSTSSSCTSNSITSQDPKITTSSDSPSTCRVSSFSNRPNGALEEYSKSAAANPDGDLDNDNILIPSDLDGDVWELLESLDPLLQSNRLERDGLNQDMNVPVITEKELGLGSDGEQEIMNLDTAMICSNAWEWDYSSYWSF